MNLLIHRSLIMTMMLPLISSLLLKNNIGAQEIELTPIWTRIADQTKEGGVNEEDHTAGVECVEFSKCGNYIASVSKRGEEVRLWTVQGDDDTRELWSFNFGDPDDRFLNEAECVTFSHDNRFVLVGGAKFVEKGPSAVQVLDRKTGTPVMNGGGPVLLPTMGSIDGMRQHPSGVFLATGDESGRIMIWDTQSPEPANWNLLHVLKQSDDHNAGDPVPEGKSEWQVEADINSIDFSADGKIMAVASRDRHVSLWDVERFSENPDRGLIRRLPGHVNSIKSVRIAPNQTLMASASARDQSVRIWTFPEGETVQILRIPSRTEAVEFSPDSRYLFAGGGTGNPAFPWPLEHQPPVVIYNVDHLKSNMPEPDPVNAVPCFRQEYFHFNKDGSNVATAHEDGTARLWSVQSNSGKIVRMESFNDLRDLDDVEIIGDAKHAFGFRYQPNQHAIERKDKTLLSHEFFAQRGSNFWAVGNLEGNPHSILINDIRVPQDSLHPNAKHRLHIALAASGNFSDSDKIVITLRLSDESEVILSRFLGTNGDLALDGEASTKINEVFRDYSWNLTRVNPTDPYSIEIKVITTTDQSSLGIDSVRIEAFK